MTDWPIYGETEADQEAYLEHEALVDYMRSQALDERAAWEQEQMERWADEAVGDESWDDLRRRVDDGHYDDVIEGIEVALDHEGNQIITAKSRPMTDAEIEALADEAEAGYDLAP